MVASFSSSSIKVVVFVVSKVVADSGFDFPFFLALALAVPPPRLLVSLLLLFFLAALAAAAFFFALSKAVRLPRRLSLRLCSSRYSLRRTFFSVLLDFFGFMADEFVEEDFFFLVNEECVVEEVVAVVAVAVVSSTPPPPFFSS